MTKITNDDLMNYADGKLDANRLAIVEAHLRTHAEDAELVAGMKAATQMLREWDAAEPVRVSEDFWPKLRDRLPAQPGRSLLGRMAESFRAWAWPSHSRLGMSVRAAVLAAILFMMFTWLSPKQSVHQVEAKEDQAFIQQSLDKHAAYVSSQPLNGGSTLPSGDVKSADRTDDDLAVDHGP